MRAPNWGLLFRPAHMDAVLRMPFRGLTAEHGGLLLLALSTQNAGGQAMSRIARMVGFMCALAMLFGAAAWAQEKELPKYNDNLYNTLAPADSKETIPPGTKITLQNWQKYRQFLPIGMRLMLEGRFVFKYPADLELDVGPTTPLPLPKKFREDSEKYNRQVKLVPTADGGLLIKGYMAGAP